MPFTFSHPAIVLPLAFIDKKKVSVTALTIGSITPDFDYFLNFKKHTIYSHTWLGILWFDLPIAVMLFYLYNKIVKEEVIDHLPVFLNRRFSRFKKAGGAAYFKKDYLIVLTSLLIGITSHLLWDKLTHRGAHIVEDPMEFYPLLWDANSVIGASVIAFIVWKMPKRKVTIKPGYFSFWFILLSVTLIFIILRSVYEVEFRQLVVASISGFFCGLIITSVVSKWRDNGIVLQKHL